MTIKELRLKTDAELNNLLTASREKLRELRFKDANKQIKNVREIRERRKTIARILTVLREKKNK